ncbi:ABC transporter permease [Halomontanus rarus]|uniref:ABC transporter permease n=1 Tax=Halomontanus rarus TaxID=3034020 RepID=UPI0023E7E0B4|nr:MULTISPECIES: ABC transporter permease [unclassified Halovivax]
MATEDQIPDDPGDSPFKSTADYDTTPAGLIQELLDIWVISPAKVVWSDYRGRIGVLIVLFYILMGTVGTVVVPLPRINQGPLLHGPLQTLEHPLGTDGIGQDLLSLMVHSTPDMLRMILAGAVFGGAMGVAIGLVSGYMGGTIDKVLMTITDTVGSIPGLPLLLILVALIEPSNPYLIGIILNIQGWAGSARGIRAQTLPLRNKEYVEASVVMGQSTSNVLFKEILPELLPMIFIGFLGGATGIINASVGLYFLGILPFTNMNWGVVLNHAYEESGALYSMDAAHWLLVPLITITMLNFGFVMLSQAFDQVFNPRVRARHERRKRDDEDGQFPNEDDDSPTDVSSQMGGL